MTDIKYIRQEVNTKGHSYTDVARRTNTDYRTVKKYADQEEFQQNTNQKKKQPSPVMDPVKDIVDQWLREDLKKKKKYRRTAKRIWQLLVKQEDFKGSDRTVRNYVSIRKRELLEESEDASLPLESRPGEAQVDFGEAPFKLNGKIVDLPYLVLSFPYSNAFLVQVFESVNQDCFLEGLKRFFHHIGGIPRSIRFDNLSPAVKKVLPRGERDLTEGFEQFALHYGFDYEFCNPGAGNEKGHVEAMVKYVRNNFFLPERAVYNIEDLNHILWQEVEEDRHRSHFEKKKEIARLYEDDEQALLYLPSKEYRNIRYETLKADNYGYVKVDTKKYSTSPRFANQEVLIGVTFNRIDVLTADREVIVRHDRLYGDKAKSWNWQPYLSLMAKRPTALKYTTFFDQLPENWRQYLQQCTHEEKKRALRLLSEILKDHDLDKASEALDIASEPGHPSTETIQQVYHQLVYGRGHRPTMTLKQSIPKMPAATRGVNQYDAFFSQGRGRVE